SDRTNGWVLWDEGNRAEESQTDGCASRKESTNSIRRTARLSSGWRTVGPPAQVLPGLFLLKHYEVRLLKHITEKQLSANALSLIASRAASRAQFRQVQQYGFGCASQGKLFREQFSR